MDQTVTPASINPLTAYMRQPKIYITLPSQGKYWNPGSLDISPTGEYPVYSMTAQDELLLKIPDALMNGQAVADVIQNCMPNVKDAWGLSTMDLDVILVAIRIATYGEMMNTPVSFKDGAELDYQFDLRTIKDQLIDQISWDPAVVVSPEMTVFVKPLNYRQFSENSVITFETQKVMQIVNDETMSEQDKLSLFKESFNKLNRATLGTIEKSIYQIDTAAGSTSNPEHIKEFISNVDKSIFTKIQSHLDRLKEQNQLKPVKLAVTQELLDLGYTGDFIEVPVTFDASSFFA
jgi:hypothetical protein